jgi:hypothetical protein
LLEEMRAAEQAYHSATAEHTKLRNEYGNMLDGLDGSDSIQEAARHERVALENYTRALRAFTDLVVYGQHPGLPAAEWVVLGTTLKIGNL